MDDHKGVFHTLRYQVGYYPKLLPCQTADWLERLIIVPGVMGFNPAVSGVISRKLILAAGPIPNTLWRGLAQCFDLNEFIDSMEDDMPLS